LRSTAKALNINLKFDEIRIKIVKTRHRKIITSVSEYELFYLLGNEKFPQITGIGSRFNMYMCQFPFDMQKGPDGNELEILSTYNMVLLNSRYTHQWYTKLIQPSLEALVLKGLPVPSIRILHPPVQQLGSPEKSESLPSISRPNVVTIAMLGMFFPGRQSKGHHEALNILEDIIRRHPKLDIQLYMIGNIHKSKESQTYVQNLRSNVTLRALPVTFLTDATHDVVAASLSKSLVFWHSQESISWPSKWTNKILPVWSISGFLSLRP
jgi:hypothetical protein